MLILWLQKEREEERDGSGGERETGTRHLTRDGSASSAKWQHQICEVLEGGLIRVSESVKHKYTSRLLKAGDVRRLTSCRLG